MYSRYTVISLILGSFLFACAPKTQTPTINEDQARQEAIRQMEMAITKEVNMRTRLSRVAYPVLSINSAACEDDAQWYAGFHSSTSIGKNDIQKVAWANLYNIEERLTVFTVILGAPAEKAWLMQGDKIISVSGKKENNGKDAKELIVEWSEEKESILKLGILRNSQELKINIQGAKTCYSWIEVKPTNDVNAFADGDKIYITSGMLEFVNSDDELALVLGHEMAHNTMGHASSKLGNRMLGALLGAAIQVLTGVYTVDLGANLGSLAYSQEFEEEADYVGCYYVQKAGYDCAGAAGLWRRMAAAHPNAINLQGSTHPSTAKRFLALNKAVEEIEEKKASGRELTPEMK